MPAMAIEVDINYSEEFSPLPWHMGWLLAVYRHFVITKMYSVLSPGMGLALPECQHWRSFIGVGTEMSDLVAYIYMHWGYYYSKV